MRLGTTACMAVSMHAIAALRVEQGVSPGMLIDAMRDYAATLPALLEHERRESPGALAVASAACDHPEIATDSFSGAFGHGTTECTHSPPPPGCHFARVSCSHSPALISQLAPPSAD